MMTNDRVPPQGPSDDSAGGVDSPTIPPGALSRLVTPCRYVDWQEAESRKYEAPVRLLRLSSGVFALFDAGWNLYAVLNGSYLLAELPIYHYTPRPRVPQINVEFDL